MNIWQPISTAPKDREILLVYEDNIIACGLFDDDIGLFVNDIQYGIMIGTRKNMHIDEQPIAWQELPVFDGVINV